MSERLSDKEWLRQFGNAVRRGIEQPNCECPNCGENVWQAPEFPSDVKRTNKELTGEVDFVCASCGMVGVEGVVWVRDDDDGGASFFSDFKHRFMKVKNRFEEDYESFCSVVAHEKRLYIKCPCCGTDRQWHCLVPVGMMHGHVRATGFDGTHFKFDASGISYECIECDEQIEDVRAEQGTAGDVDSIEFER